MPYDDGTRARKKPSEEASGNEQLKSGQPSTVGVSFQYQSSEDGVADIEAFLQSTTSQRWWIVVRGLSTFQSSSWGGVLTLCSKRMDEGAGEEHCSRQRPGVLDPASAPTLSVSLDPDAPQDSPRFPEATCANFPTLL